MFLFAAEVFVSHSSAMLLVVFFRLKCFEVRLCFDCEMYLCEYDVLSHISVVSQFSQRRAILVENGESFSVY